MLISETIKVSDWSVNIRHLLHNMRYTVPSLINEAKLMRW